MHGIAELELFGQHIVIGPSIVGLVIEVILVVLLIRGFRKFRHTSFMMFFVYIFESIYAFFEEILGKKEDLRIKQFVITLFFVILISNFLGIALEFLAPIFGFTAGGNFVLEEYIAIPTADINFNIAMALVSVLLVIFIQLRHLGFGKFIYEYLPVWGKDFLPIERGNMKAIIYYPLFVLVKAFDIVISMFLSVLEIIGFGAKIVSLSFRLFGNMTSGTILLAMLVLAMGTATSFLGGLQLPIGVPLLIYAQEILVALIQALVFSLLVAIFIKVAKAE